MKNYFQRIKNMEPLDLVSNIVVTLGALLSIFPLYWLLISGFKTSTDIFKIPPDWWPVNPTTANYTDLFNQQPAIRWMFNSILVSFGAAVLIVLFASMAAYAFSKINFAGSKVLFVIFICSLMIPKEILIVPLFNIVNIFKLTNSYAGLILPNVATTFGVFMLKGFFDTIPNSLRESAKIDGANEYRTFFQIMLPIAKPGIGALFILSFVNTWNDYLWQLVSVTDRDMKTLMVGIASIMQEIIPNFGYKMAGATVAAIPMLIIFVMFQKYFTSGITMGAVKE